MQGNNGRYPGEADWYQTYHFAEEWKLFGMKWGAGEGERNVAGRSLCQQCGSKQSLV